MLAALVPPPRIHLIRYHGVLAPAAADRQRIVPGPADLTKPDDQLPDAELADEPTDRRCRQHRVPRSGPGCRRGGGPRPAGKGAAQQAGYSLFLDSRHGGAQLDARLGWTPVLGSRGGQVAAYLAAGYRWR